MTLLFFTPIPDTRDPAKVVVLFCMPTSDYSLLGLAIMPHQIQPPDYPIDIGRLSSCWFWVCVVLNESGLVRIILEGGWGGGVEGGAKRWKGCAPPLPHLLSFPMIHM